MYQGYLAPYLPAMKIAYQEGLSTVQIARALSSAGVMSPCGCEPSSSLVYFALGLKAKKLVVTIKRSDWHSWTPKKQFLEFEGELHD